MKYEPGQFYKQHHDQNAAPQSLWGPRVMTFYLYLSNVTHGGGTRFPRLNITVEARAGRAVLWPSVLDGKPLETDVRTQHESVSVGKDEIKYGCNFWIHLRNFRDPFMNNCAQRHGLPS